MKKFFISLMMMAMVASMILAVTQVGSLIVTIKSKEGQLLPGASVMIKSAAMIGTRAQATGANGKTTFRNLPPGEYVVNVNMDKFQPVERTGVFVSIQKTTKIDVELELGAADEVITVVATSPIIDTSSSTVVQDFDFENSINHMPTG
ncbi:MAG: carboxypeptidase regulatory-like domain-containing protein, partial [Acidobacteria bacterium]|nr:carboxypeptidase regulatory-like domain-containing protein [Acidobacteriota bacterium]